MGFFVLNACEAQQPKVENVFSQVESQTEVMLKAIDEAKSSVSEDEDLVSPRSLSPTGELELVPAKDWTSGFFPGVLWYLYDHTGNTEWLEHAKKFTAEIGNEKNNGKTHDMGFKVYSSFGNGYRLTKDPEYKDVIVTAARTLSTRYNPTVGAIRSWDHNSDKWDFPVIIDNMMNLELLFEATRLSGDSAFYDIAVSHANTTMKNHFREDFSSYHVVDYDPATGKVENKHTHQGYSHESVWTRGQAWGLYGYTMCYRETKNPAYLELAEKIADFILDHPKMPKDLVPYWDFSDPEIPNAPRDASAAAVTASGLYELSTLVENGGKFKKAADNIMKSLADKYTSPVGENKGFILMHSTGHKPHDSEVDGPIIYSDYYYVEALLRKEKL